MGEINFVVVVYSRWIYVRMIRNSSKALLHFGTRGMIICWMRLTYKLTSLPHHAPSSMHKSYLVIPRTSLCLVMPRYAPLCLVLCLVSLVISSLCLVMPRHGPSFLVIANITRKWYWKCHIKKRELTHLCHYRCRNRSVAAQRA